MNVRLWTVPIVLATAGAMSAGVTANQARSFSGTWTAVKDAPAGIAAAPGPVFGARFAMRHDGETLALTRPSRDTIVEATYPLDGREVKTRLPGRTCEGDAYTIETAVREGDAIVFTGLGTIAPGGTATKTAVKRVFRLEAPDTLIVEGTMVQPGQSRTVATVYKRSSDPLVPAAAPPRPTGATAAAATIADVSWIGGVWIGGTSSVVEERWTPPSGGSMLAISRTMRNNIMSAFEFLCIVERNGGLVYTAMPNARMPPTDFTLTQITPDSATFENPSHDYPKMIRYARRPDGSLETTIAGEGGQRPISVLLKKQ